MIFLKTTPEFAERVRQLLKIEEKNENSWFDPNDTGRIISFDKLNVGKNCENLGLKKKDFISYRGYFLFDSLFKRLEYKVPF